MATALVNFYCKYSFLTQATLKGWRNENQPIWEKMLYYNSDRWPMWSDWEETKEKFISPLCNLTSSVALFGNEWLSENIEVQAVKDIVSTQFQKEGRYLICRAPRELTDASLFWTGGSSKCFHLMQVLIFDIKSLEPVLNILQRHQLAGVQSSRSGGEWTRLNTFAKSVVKKGGFAVVVYGHEAEVFYPVECKMQIEEYGNRVMERMRQEMQLVKSRTQSGL
jgi:hypothetical protein